MSHRIAIIDLGTNTFHLLIVDIDKDEYQIIHRERVAVKLGEKGINQDIITGAAIDRALKSIQQFRTSIDQLKATKIFAYGTSAFRNAQNQVAVVEAIEIATEIKVEIISGDKEARLIYLGVRSALPLGKEKALVVDIGGGSVEFIIGNDSEIFWKQSFEIGAQRLLEEYHQHDPIRTEDLVALQLHFKSILHPLFSALNLHQPKALVGSSGTFDTLSDIFCLSHQIEKSPDSPEAPLSFAGFHSIYKELISKNRSERMEIPGMIELRVDMIVVASSLIDYLLHQFTFKDIRVSSYALKEGVLAEIMEASQKDRASLHSKR